MPVLASKHSTMKSKLDQFFYLRKRWSTIFSRLSKSQIENLNLKIESQKEHAKSLKDLEELLDVSEEDEATTEEEEEGSEEEEEVESDQPEEDKEIFSQETTKSIPLKKRKFAKLQTSSRNKRDGKAAGAAKKQKMTPPTPIPVPKEVEKKKCENLKQDEIVGEDDGKASNAPTITFGKSTIRDYSQPMKKFIRDKFLLGKFISVFSHRSR